ncbi:MAG: transposase, partial [Mangrovibacterium sp.]
HICITFVAYKIYKELDRQLKAKGATLSPEKAIEIAKTIYTIKVETPASKLLERTLLLSQEQKYLANLFEF